MYFNPYSVGVENRCAVYFSLTREVSIGTGVCIGAIRLPDD